MTEPGMETTPIFLRLVEILRDILGDDATAFTPETTAADVAGWDSFNHVNVIVAVETAFDIRFGTREIDAMQTVGDMARAVGAKLGG